MGRSKADMGNMTQPRFVGNIEAAADYLAPGAIEVNRYQAEIFDLVRRRFVLGQRINQVPAAAHPGRDLRLAQSS